MSDKLLSTSQVAQYLSISGTRVRQLIEAGRLKATRVGGRYVVEQTDLDIFCQVPRSRTGRPIKSLQKRKDL